MLNLMKTPIPEIVQNLTRIKYIFVKVFKHLGGSDGSDWRMSIITHV